MTHPCNKPIILSMDWLEESDSCLGVNPEIVPLIGFVNQAQIGTGTQTCRKIFLQVIPVCNK